MKTEILEKGYFPQELPPPFSSKPLGSAFGVTTPAPFQAHFVGHCTTHNLSRTGSLRRKLSIPNPISYIQLADYVASNWTQLNSLVQVSPLSISKPSLAGLRAINRQTQMKDIPEIRAISRSGCRFVLATDISRFYPSIYTHSIPWAIHSKATAKGNRSQTLIGNRLDYLIRNSQDTQTLGIPIGPDISFLVAEIILGQIDLALTQKFPGLKGFRYVDDYELSFKTAAEAQDVLSFLQEELNEFELALNPRKTRIIDLPQPTERPWAAELRNFSISNFPKTQKYDLIRFFDRAFILHAENPDESVLKYAFSRASAVLIDSSNWELFEAFTMQLIALEAGSLSTTIAVLKHYQNAGYSLGLAKIEEVLNQVIHTHSPQGHGSEVAWAIWGCIELGTKINHAATQRLLALEDSVVALVALHAFACQAYSQPPSFTPYLGFLNQSELVGSMWLRSYEANFKGWLPSGTPDYVSSDPLFSILKSSSVSFYDINARISPKSPLTFSSGGFSGGGGINPYNQRSRILMVRKTR